MSGKRLFLLIVTVVIVILFSTFLIADVKTCMECHSDKELTKTLPNGQEESLFISEVVFKQSVHGDLDCTDCHTDLQDVKDFPHKENLQKVDCGQCHDDIVSEYKTSYHYRVRELGRKDAPTCVTCHGTHNIMSTDNRFSPIYKRNVYKLCGKCHSEKVARKEGVAMPHIFENYTHSIHAQAINSGNLSAASCIDCHTAHSMRSPGDPKSTINRWQIPKTCSKCHKKEYDDYMSSIHGKAFSMGIIETPICTDCHGEHLILGEESKDKESVFNTLTSYKLCLDCHNNPRIKRKFGLTLAEGAEYVDSYHGMSINLNNKRAATCTSCHGVHKILPQRDPHSTIAPLNVAHTCSKCHPGASEKFARSYTHEAASVKQNKIVGLIQEIYIILIILVIGGMVVHNFIILIYYIKKKYKHEKDKPSLTRFNLQEIIQHLLLTISFITLAITGFMLRFSHYSWIQDIVSLTGFTEDIRSTIHRICAVVLVGTGIWHVIYMATTKEGRRQLLSIIFMLDDIKQAILNIKYHLGFSKQKPVFDRYDYTEKMEYWALIWGTIVMAFTGAVLWFPVYFTSIFPWWIVKVSETIHFYEAILATLAILVWHFFFVILHPEEYPMNLTWLTGKIDVDLAEEKYPLWVHREIKKEQQEKK